MFQTIGLPLPTPRFLFRTVAVNAKFHTRDHVVCGFEVGCPGFAPIVTHKTRTEVVTKEILIISIILFKIVSLAGVVSIGEGSSINACPSCEHSQVTSVPLRGASVVMCEP